MRSRATPSETLHVLCSESHVLLKAMEPGDGTISVSGDPLLRFEDLLENDGACYWYHGRQPDFLKAGNEDSNHFLHHVPWKTDLLQRTTSLFTTC